MTLPSNLSTDQADQEGTNRPDDRARYPAADMDSGRPASAADTDEDLIVLDPDEDVIVLDPDDDVDEVVDAAPDDEDAEPAGVAGPGNLAVDEQAAVSEPAEVAAHDGQPGTTEQWHDIQALFVDDPRGSVQLALQAVDGALTTFVQGLREQQAALTPDARLGDTERLRATLRSSRAFWENLVRLGGELRPSG